MLRFRVLLLSILVALGAVFFVFFMKPELVYPSWTSKDIPDLSGKVSLITGANTGLGFASGIQFNSFFLSERIEKLIRPLYYSQASLEKRFSRYPCLPKQKKV